MAPMSASMKACVIHKAAWRNPVTVAAAFAEEDHAACLLSDGGRGAHPRA